ncbi:MAG: NADH-quinone oxidoreductase subunit C [Bdellovibrionales bacterium]|nr:NADH-quinone oxidoreductase subunit C [Bdellovibrionales bacterium]
MLVDARIQKHIEKEIAKFICASGVISNDFWIQIDGKHTHEVIEFLLNDSQCQFDRFVDLCGVDYFPKTPRFESVVHLYSSSQKHRIRLRVIVPEDTFSIPSITPFWKGADWQERESFDMYGIRYQGHPNLKRILSPPETDVYPQRKDYPLKGERDKGDDL